MRTPIWYKRFIIFLPVIFSHKPLCAKFRKDLLSVRDIYFCRSCCFLLLGFFTGILSLSFFNLAEYRVYIYSSIILAELIVIFSNPRIYETFSRFIKDYLRFFLGWSLANLLFLLIYGELFLFLGAAVFLWLLKEAYSAIGNQIQSRACDECEEFSREKLCSGFRTKAKFMNKYEALLTEYGIFGSGLK